MLTGYRDKRMHQGEVKNQNRIGTTEALALVREKAGIDITLPTLIAWARKNNLGRQFGNRWFIDKDSLIDYLETNNGRK